MSEGGWQRDWASLCESQGTHVPLLPFLLSSLCLPWVCVLFCLLPLAPLASSFLSVPASVQPLDPSNSKHSWIANMGLPFEIHGSGKTNKQTNENAGSEAQKEQQV